MSKPAKVVLFTHDSIYARILLAKLSARSEIQVVGVVCSTAIMRRGKSFIADAWRLWRHCGLRYIGHLLWATECYPRMQRYFPSLRTLTKQMGCSILYTNDVNAPAMVKKLQHLDADYYLSGYFNQIFSPQVLALPRVQAVNIHPSPLPYFRGVDPVVSAAALGQVQFGVSLHVLSDEIDDGALLAQKTLSPCKDVCATYQHLFSVGVDLAIAHFAEPKDPKPQVGEPSYYSWPSPKDYRLACRFLKVQG